MPKGPPFVTINDKYCAQLLAEEHARRGFKGKQNLARTATTIICSHLEMLAHLRKEKLIPKRVTQATLDKATSNS